MTFDAPIQHVKYGTQFRRLHGYHVLFDTEYTMDMLDLSPYKVLDKILIRVVFNLSYITVSLHQNSSLLPYIKLSRVDTCLLITDGFVHVMLVRATAST